MKNISLKLIGLIITFSIISTLSFSAFASEKHNKHHVFTATNKDQLGEVCPELKNGQTLAFEFKAKQTVKFNLHYHEDKNVVYPIKETEITELKDKFTAPIDQTYCLMWTALTDNTKVSVSYWIE